VSQRRLLAFSLALGLLSALLMYRYVKSSEVDHVIEEAEEVVIVLKDIRPKTELTAEFLSVKRVPKPEMQAGALKDLDAAVGRLTKESLYGGEQVCESRLYARDEKPGLTFVIPPGKRAISVAVNEVIGVAGFIKPGDRVDVLGTFDEQAVGKTVTVTVLQDVEVLAISQRMEDKNPGAVVATTVTLALTLDEAEKVTLAEEQGRLRLALRPAGPGGEEYTAAATADRMITGRSGKELQQVVPGASRPKNTPTSASHSPPPTAVKDEHEGWSIELFRGVERQLVEVEL
jgi:pilus assembly protein CpaB